MLMRKWFAIKIKANTKQVQIFFAHIRRHNNVMKVILEGKKNRRGQKKSSGMALKKRWVEKIET